MDNISTNIIPRGVTLHYQYDMSCGQMRTLKLCSWIIATQYLVLYMWKTGLHLPEITIIVEFVGFIDIPRHEAGVIFWEWLSIPISHPLCIIEIRARNFASRIRGFYMTNLPGERTFRNPSYDCTLDAWTMALHKARALSTWYLGLFMQHVRCTLYVTLFNRQGAFPRFRCPP